MCITAMMRPRDWWPSTIPLIYLAGASLATAIYILAGDNSYYWFFHVGFAVALAGLMCCTNTVVQLIKGFLTNWGGLCLLGFLLYYLSSAITHPLRAVVDGHLRYLYASVIPGLLLGFVAFGQINLVRIRELGIVSERIRALLAEGAIAIVMAACVVVLVAVLGALFTIRRPDIFLIANLSGGDDTPYQVAGSYVLLAYVVKIAIGYAYYSRRTTTTRRFIVFLGLQTALAVVVGMLLSLVGAIKEVVALFLIWTLLIYYSKPRSWLIRGKKLHAKNAALVMLFVVGIATSSVWLWQSGMQLPALRLLAFGDDVSVIFRHPNLVSRIELLMGPGLDQLSLDPIFGDLGAEYRFGGPGLYIHSIISTQSHLGIVGTTLLLGYFVHRLYRLYVAANSQVLKVITPPILFVSIIATFFTWMPLWFLIGALFAPRHSYQHEGTDSPERFTGS